jgi:hypothetical protein
MEVRPRTTRRQLELFPGEEKREDLKLPEEITDDLVEVLAALLLEAADVLRSRREGGGDEPEDHA